MNQGYLFILRMTYRLFWMYHLEKLKHLFFLSFVRHTVSHLHTNQVSSFAYFFNQRQVGWKPLIFHLIETILFVKTPVKSLLQGA